MVQWVSGAMRRTQCNLRISLLIGLAVLFPFADFAVPCRQTFAARGEVRVLSAVGMQQVMLDLGPSARSADIAEPIRGTLVFRGTEREYFVYLPPGFSRNAKYWALVAVGGFDGRTFFLATGSARRVAESRFNAIVISPSFATDDINAIRFPSLGEGEFLQAVMREVQKKYPLRPKMLLTGYSRGGQFAHRFALALPKQVEAVAPFASGSWTTPDGRFLVEEVGEVRHPREFLSNPANAATIPARLKDLFEPRVAAVADAKAVAGAQNVPFLVMCGTLDPRLPIAKEFVRSLETQGYHVTVEWPRTPHNCGDDKCREEYETEFQKYPRTAVEFFQKIVQAPPQ
jgi:poly(3-hydroxybutyrate) depolymerase